MEQTCSFRKYSLVIQVYPRLFLFFSLELLLSTSDGNPRNDRKKICENLNINEYLLMGWSENHISLKCQRFMTLTPAHQQIFIEN